MSDDSAHSETQEMPPTTAIMVVDTEKFSKHTDTQQEYLARLMPDVLADAFTRADLAEVWDERQFPDSTGDGFIIGFAPARLPFVVDRFVPALQQELRERARTMLSLDMRLRMRLSLHVGPARLLNSLHADSPVGNPMIDTHRLVDTHAVRVLLAKSDPAVTFLAAIMSDLVIDWAVGKGGRTWTRSSQFCQVPVRVEAKDFQGTAYLRVPELSGELLANGLIGVQSAPAESEPPRAPRADRTAGRGRESTRIGNVSGGSSVIGSVSGSHNSVTGGNTYRPASGGGVR